MPTNSNYLSVVVGFSNGKYITGTGVCPGSDSFSASVLFFQAINNDNTQRALWSSGNG
jgi:hypothetical protein